MHTVTKLLLTCSLLTAPALALAAKGVVVFTRSSCDYYIVETQSGFALLEWYGGYTPDQGDVIVGDFESYGMKDIYDVTADSDTTVWVEDYFLSQEDAASQYIEQCK